VGYDEYVGQAVPIEDRVYISTRILPRFQERFGREVVDAWFGKHPTGFTLVPKVQKEGSHHQSLAAYFDSIAASYDAQVMRNPWDRALRTVSLELLESVFLPGQRVLDIGCGTGLESLPLARRGIEVVGMDISMRMLSLLEARARSEGLSERITLVHESTQYVDRIVRRFGEGYFDGAFSTFGALNCEPELGPVASALYRLIRPGGPLVLGIWNRFCAVEFLGYLMRGRWSRAFARFHDFVPVGMSRFGLPVRAYSVHDVVAKFRSGFKVVRVIGLPVFLPPYDFESHFSRRRNLVSTLDRIDRRLRGHLPFNRVGDHFLLQLRRRE